MCGFDLRRGHRLKTRIGSAIDLEAEDLGDLPVHGVVQLDEAERRMARDVQERKHLTKGAPWWMVLLALLGLVGFTVAMVSMPQGRVMETSGIVMQVAGGLMLAFFTIRLLIDGFREAPLHGVGMLLLPPYAILYVVQRWDRVSGIVIFMAVGGAMCGTGVFMAQVLTRYF
jgi:hypothetical protein